jgi:transposase
MLLLLMTYSLDLRQRVVTYIKEGGMQSEASRFFKVSPKTIYNWLHRENLQPKKHGYRRRKLCRASLKRHVEKYPDAILRERAKHFEVHIHAIWYALRQINIRKKNS